MTIAPKPRYEPGMRIDYDPQTRIATVAFRARLVTLGQFLTERDAQRAGEDYCRKHGWAEKPVGIAARSLLKHRQVRLF